VGDWLDICPWVASRVDLEEFGAEGEEAEVDRVALLPPLPLHLLQPARQASARDSARVCVGDKECVCMRDKECLCA
jgi:hypothetical protein